MSTQLSDELRRLADKAENPDLESAVRDLMNFTVPFPNLADPVCADCGWGEEEHKAGGNGGDDHPFKGKPDEDVPFFTEAYLYDLFGKDAARTILVYVRGVLRAAGVPEKDFR